MISGKREIPELYFEWQKLYSLERTDEGRLKILEKMLESLPLGYSEFNNVRSHTTQMMRFIRERIAHRKAQQESVELSRSFFKTEFFSVALIGEANSGKTRLFNELCKTSHESTLAPFETKSSNIGVFKHGGGIIRVVDLPSSLKSVHVRVLKESDLIIIMPGSIDFFTRFIQDNFIETPFKVLKDYPKNLWDFLDLIVVSIDSRLIVFTKGVTLRDLGLTRVKVNSVKEKNDYVLHDGDVIISDLIS